GAGACFLLNAVSYVGLLAALVLLRPAEFHVSAEEIRRSGESGGIGEMLRFVWSSPNIVFELVVTALLGAFGYNFSTALLPPIARNAPVRGARGVFAFGL